MPIQFPNIPQLTFDQSNPALAGAQAGQKLIGGQQDIISALLNQQKAQALLPYAGPQAAADLQKTLLANKWFGPTAQSTIGLQGAEAGLYGAQAVQAKANAAKLIAIQDAINRTFSGQGTPFPGGQGQVGGQGQSGGTPQGGGVPMPQSSQNTLPDYLKTNMSQTQPQDQNQTASSQDNTGQAQTPSNGMNYAQAALVSHYMGLPPPKIVDLNGTQTAVTPFGNFPVAQGLTALQKNLAKEDAKAISGLEDSVVTGERKQTTLNEIAQIVSSPAFEEMRQHPILGNYELAGYQKYGTPEQQRIVGNLMTNIGNVVKDAAGDFKGSFRVGEQGLINSTKVNPSDTVESAKGKVQAQMLLNTMFTERSRIMADLMRHKGMSRIEAIDAADKMMNGQEIRDHIKDKLTLVTIRHKQTGQVERVTREEAKSRGIPNV